MNTPARKDLPRITMRSCYRIGPHLRRELVARLMGLAFEIEDTFYLSERQPLQDKFAAIADLLSIRRTP